MLQKIDDWTRRNATALMAITTILVLMSLVLTIVKGPGGGALAGTLGIFAVTLLGRTSGRWILRYYPVLASLLCFAIYRTEVMAGDPVSIAAMAISALAVGLALAPLRPAKVKAESAATAVEASQVQVAADKGA